MSNRSTPIGISNDQLSPGWYIAKYNAPTYIGRTSEPEFIFLSKRYPSMSGDLFEWTVSRCGRHSLYTTANITFILGPLDINRVLAQLTILNAVQDMNERLPF